MKNIFLKVTLFGAGMLGLACGGTSETSVEGPFLGAGGGMQNAAGRSGMTPRAGSPAVAPPGMMPAAESPGVTPPGMTPPAESPAVTPPGMMPPAESPAVAPPGMAPPAESPAVTPPGMMPPAESPPGMATPPETPVAPPPAVPPAPVGGGGSSAQPPTAGSGGQSAGGSGGQEPAMAGAAGAEQGMAGSPPQEADRACGDRVAYGGGVRPAKLEGFGAKAKGGQGGKEVTVSSGKGIHEAMCGRASETEPLIIKLDGTVNHGNTEKVSGSCDTKDDTIEFKGVSNISLIGVGSKGVLDQVGIHIVDSSNIIIQNINVKNVKKSNGQTSNGGDAIGMEKANSDIWIDHCTLEASGGEDQGYDGLLDMKGNTKNVTVSYTRFYNSGRGGLIGSGDGDTGSTNITFHHNYYEKIESRTPLMRGATVHAYNNHYNGIVKSGINSRVGGKAKVEHCYFENARNPLGTFYTDKPGTWEVKDNCFESTVVWEPTEGDQENPAGPNPTSTGSVGVSYQYTLDPVMEVPGILEANAGHGKL